MESKNIDLNYLYKLTGNDKNEVYEFVLDVLNMTENVISTIDSAVEKEDYKLISESAHKIKSSLKIFGSHTMVQILSSLETNATSTQDKNEVVSLYSSLKHELPLWEKELMMEVNKL